MDKLQEYNEIMSVDYFKNDIDFYLTEFQEINEIDLKTCSQSQFNACLIYVQQKVFFDKSLLKDHTKNTNSNNYVPSNNNRYNYELISSICDYYIYICLIYNKIPSIYSFCYLVPINEYVVYNWSKDEPTSATYQICKKLIDRREQNLSDKLTENKSNAIGTLAVLNHVYGWNMPSSNNGQIEQSRTIESIRSRYNVELIEENNT